jgi:hypothetical protein
MCRSRSLPDAGHGSIVRVLNESAATSGETGPYDDLPAWAVAALADAPTPDSTVERLKLGLSTALDVAYPGAGLVVSASGGNVTVVWQGGPTMTDVLSAADLAWAFEDRGAWIATVDYADPSVWPEGEVVSFVFRRRNT